MPYDLAVVAGAALFGAAAGALLPAVLARLPEPEPAPELDPVSPAGATATVKVPYVTLARTPGLAVGSAAAAATACALVAWRLGWSAPLPAWLYLAVVGVLLAWIDARTRLLPTRIVGPSYLIVAALLLAASAVEGDWHALARAGLGWAIAGGSFLLLWVIHPRGMGYGDVRLAGILGMALGWLGWAEFGIGMYAGFLLGGVVGAVLVLLHLVDRKRYPFGPFMLAGALVGLVWGPAIVDWYVGARR